MGLSPSRSVKLLVPLLSQDHVTSSLSRFSCFVEITQSCKTSYKTKLVMQRRPISSLFFFSSFFTAGVRDNYSWTLVILNAMIQGHLQFRSALVSQKSGFDIFFFSFFLLKKGKAERLRELIRARSLHLHCSAMEEHKVHRSSRSFRSRRSCNVSDLGGEPQDDCAALL